MGPPNPKQFKGEDSLARTPERNTTERKDREEQENPRERNFQPPTKQGTLSPPPPPEQCWAGRANVCLCEKKYFAHTSLFGGGRGDAHSRKMRTLVLSGVVRIRLRCLSFLFSRTCFALTDGPRVARLIFVGGGRLEALLCSPLWWGCLRNKRSFWFAQDFPATPPERSRHCQELPRVCFRIA
mgnify:CR=1 FL=1